MIRQILAKFFYWLLLYKSWPTYWYLDCWDTVQQYLLARVIFGEFVCEKQLADIILAIWVTTSFFSSFFILSNGFVGIVINIGYFNIGEFTEKLPIANINFSPINRLVRYSCLFIVPEIWALLCRAIGSHIKNNFNGWFFCCLGCCRGGTTRLTFVQ